EELATGISDLDLLLARARGMAISYRARLDTEGCREGSIDEVIRSQRRELNLPASADAIFLQVEIEYETANLTANAVLLDVVREFRESGGSAILTSDMYLGKSVISSI